MARRNIKTGKQSTGGINLSAADQVWTACYVLGAVAQMGERRVRNAKVGSSILLRSTTLLHQRQRPTALSPG